MSVSTHTENIIEPVHLFHASQVHTAPVIVPNKSNDEFRKARRLNRSVASKVWILQFSNIYQSYHGNLIILEIPHHSSSAQLQSSGRTVRESFFCSFAHRSIIQKKKNLYQHTQSPLVLTDMIIRANLTVLAIPQKHCSKNRCEKEADVSLNYWFTLSCFFKVIFRKISSLHYINLGLHNWFWLWSEMWLQQCWALPQFAKFLKWYWSLMVQQNQSY